MFTPPHHGDFPGNAFLSEPASAIWAYLNGRGSLILYMIKLINPSCSGKSKLNVTEGSDV